MPNFDVMLLISTEPDVVMQYCFGWSDHRVEADGFDPEFHRTSFAAASYCAYETHELDFANHQTASGIMGHAYGSGNGIFRYVKESKLLVWEAYLMCNLLAHILRNGAIKLRTSDTIPTSERRMRRILQSSMTFSAAHSPRARRAQSV